MTSASTATTAAPLHATVELHATGRGTLRMNNRVRPIVAPDTAGNHARPLSDVGKHTARRRLTHRGWAPARSGAPNAADTATGGD